MTEKTLQEIMDEQRLLSKVHTLSKQSIANFINMSNPDTIKKISDAGKGREPSTKGKPLSADHKTSLSKSKKGKSSPKKYISKYMFFSDKGAFTNIHDLASMHTDLNLDILRDYTLREVHGFSRKLKDD